MGVLLIFNGIGSIQRLLDLLKLAYSFDLVKEVILLRISGAVAISGLPEAFKIAIKKNKNLLIFNKLEDIVEIFNLKDVLIIDDKYGEETSINELSCEGVFMIPSSEIEISKEDLAYGKKIKINGIPSLSIGQVAFTSIFLYELSKKCK